MIYRQNKLNTNIYLCPSSKYIQTYSQLASCCKSQWSAFEELLYAVGNPMLLLDVQLKWLLGVPATKSCTSYHLQRLPCHAHRPHSHYHGQQYWRGCPGAQDQQVKEPERATDPLAHRPSHCHQQHHERQPARSWSIRPVQPLAGCAFGIH